MATGKTGTSSDLCFESLDGSFNLDYSGTSVINSYDSNENISNEADIEVEDKSESARDKKYYSCSSTSDFGGNTSNSCTEGDEESSSKTGSDDTTDSRMFVIGGRKKCDIWKKTEAEKKEQLRKRVELEMAWQKFQSGKDYLWKKEKARVERKLRADQKKEQRMLEKQLQSWEQYQDILEEEILQRDMESKWIKEKVCCVYSA